jgi:hypothetical protein
MRRPTQEELTNPKRAYLYAANVIKGRFVKGEPIIATSSAYACLYAKNIIHGRFEQGESIIATHPVSAYIYALDVIKERFKQGEAAIATSPEWAYYYAKNVLKFGIKNKHKLIHIDFYEQCFQSNTIDIHQLPQKLRNHDDIQLAYFKAKVLP